MKTVNIPWNKLFNLENLTTFLNRFHIDFPLNGRAGQGSKETPPFLSHGLRFKLKVS